MSVAASPVEGAARFDDVLPVHALFDFLGTVVRVQTASVGQLQYWDAVYADFRIFGVEPDVTVRVYDRLANDPPVFATIETGGKRRMWDRHEPLLPPLRDGGLDALLYLQAVAVGRADHALVLLGGPHCGKTTMGVALGVRGACLIADGVLPVDPDDLLVLPFPKSLRLRRASLELLSIPLEHPSLDPFVTRAGELEWRARPGSLLGRKGTPGGTEVGAVVLLEPGDWQADPVLRPLSKGEAFEQVVRHLNHRPANKRRATDALVRLCRRVPAYGLTPGPPSPTAELLEGLLD